MKGGLTIRTIPKNMKITLSRSTGKIDSLMNMRAKKTVNIGEVAVIKVVSVKGRC